LKPSPEIPLRFLLASSNSVLGEYELARLNLAANLRKHLRELINQIVDETAEARFARWLLDHRDELSALRTLGDAAGTLDGGLGIEEAFDLEPRTLRDTLPEAGVAHGAEAHTLPLGQVAAD